MCTYIYVYPNGVISLYKESKRNEKIRDCGKNIILYSFLRSVHDKYNINISVDNCIRDSFINIIHFINLTNGTERTMRESSCKEDQRKYIIRNITIKNIT